MSKIDDLREAMKPHFGPISPFLLKKQIAVMGESADCFPNSRLKELIDKVIEAGIYDESKKRAVRSALLKGLKNN